MKVFSGGTVRFAKVVELAGNPQVISLWTRPERDRPFMTAVRQNRVMTIKQETVGSAKDFGIVGFLREKNVSYLVFPRSLDAFKDRRVIGIKYDLVETPEPLGRVVKPDRRLTASRTRKTRSTTPRPAPMANQPSLAKQKKTFRVSVRFTATAEVHQTVAADSKKLAAKLALQHAVMPDFRHGTVTRKVSKLTQE